MSVTASFQQEQVTAGAGETVALALHLQNNTDAERMVTLKPSGSLADQTVLQSETIYLDPNENFEVSVILDAGATLAAGSHDCAIDVIDGDETVTASATITVASTSSWSARLDPPRSASASAGRHKVAVQNNGNVPLTVEITPLALGDVTTELAAPAISVDPGKTAKVEVRVAPLSKFWNGAPLDHAFVVDVAGDDGTQHRLEGNYEQGPRLRPWVAPALAGMLGALALGAISWFALLKPSVENIAQSEATTLDAAQNEIIQQQVAEMEAAAAEASELPLGQPADVQLSVTAGAAESATFGQVLNQSGAGRRFSISDVVFQNPTGAVGRLQLIRQAGDEPDALADGVLLDQEMANFRDLDFHFVAPLSIDSGQTIVLRVECTTPGPGSDQCEASALITGFVDDL